MQARLISQTLVPYGGTYVIDEPAKGLVGQGYTFEVLVSNVKKWRTANGLPNGLAVEEELEQLVCQKYPESCRNVDPNAPRKVKLSWRDALAGTKTMLAHKLAGSPLVSKDEATNRASVCKSCPWRSEFSLRCGSSLCGELKAIVDGLTGHGATPFEDELKNAVCGVCHCYISAAVWLPLDIQCQGVDADKRAKFTKVLEQYPCWKQCG